MKKITISSCGECKFCTKGDIFVAKALRAEEDDYRVINGGLNGYCREFNLGLKDLSIIHPHCDLPNE